MYPLIALKKVVLSLIGVASVCHQTSGPFDNCSDFTLLCFILCSEHYAISNCFYLRRLQSIAYCCLHREHTWMIDDGRCLARAVAFSGSGVQITGCSACHQSAFISDVLLTTLHALRVIVPCDSVEVLQITPQTFLSSHDLQFRVVVWGFQLAFSKPLLCQTPGH